MESIIIISLCDVSLNVWLLLSLVWLSELLRPGVPGGHSGDVVVVIHVELVPDPLLFVLWLGIDGSRLVFVRLLRDLRSNTERAVADLGQRGVHPAHGVVLRCNLLSQGLVKIKGISLC